MTAIGLPLFELALGGLLLSKRWLRAAALGALTMTVVFIVALGFALVRGIKVDCGCFGTNHIDSVALNYVTLGRDLLLGMRTAVLYWQASNAGKGSIATGEKSLERA